nr:unnamed protein product [Callosobruchus analis]
MLKNLRVLLFVTKLYLRGKSEQRKENVGSSFRFGVEFGACSILTSELQIEDAEQVRNFLDMNVGRFNMQGCPITARCPLLDLPFKLEKHFPNKKRFLLNGLLILLFKERNVSSISGLSGCKPYLKSLLQVDHLKRKVFYLKLFL